MLLLPNCKINLGLQVVRKRPDGYHDLQTVFYPIPLRDNLELRELRNSDAPYALQLAGQTIEGNPDDNLIIKVYRQLKEEFDLPALDIYLYKHIPLGAGLGGGSSDAAFMMKGLNEVFELGLSDYEMERRLAGLGADCAFFVQNVPAYATGIGDELTPISLSLKGMYIVLVKPDVFVSTREAYAGVTPKEPEHDLLKALRRPVTEWRDRVVNDFERSVFAAHPELPAIKQTLYDMGALYAAMSGSGSALFGIFREQPTGLEKEFEGMFCQVMKL